MAEKEKAPKEGEEVKSKKKLFIIIGAVVAVLIIGGVIAFFLLSSSKKSEEPAPGDNVPVPQIASPTVGPMVDVNDFVVNIVSEDATHYVKASMTLELSAPPVSEEVTMRMPQMRDTILLIIGSKEFRELQDIQGKKQLKAEIMSRINSILQTGKVTSIYFTEFVVQ